MLKKIKKKKKRFWKPENWFTLQIPGKDNEWAALGIYECHEYEGKTKTKKKESVTIRQYKEKQKISNTRE